MTQRYKKWIQRHKKEKDEIVQFLDIFFSYDVPYLIKGTLKALVRRQINSHDVRNRVRTLKNYKWGF